MATTTTSSLPRTMKAWQFTSVTPTLEQNLHLNPAAPLPPKSSLPLPPDQILIQVLATSLNPIDYKFPEIPLLGRLFTGSPAIPGIDFAGRVAATGPNTGKISKTDLKKGQLVYGRLGIGKHGTLAEYTMAPRAGCVPIPRGVSVIDAACAASVSLTAYQAIIPKLSGGVAGGKNKRIFINGGSGGTGTFGIQIAKAIGCFVVTTCSTTNVELCKSLGADVVIDYKTTDVVAELKKMASSSSSSAAHFDLIVDFVGTPENLYSACPSFTKPGAPYVQVGAAAIDLKFVVGMMVKTYWPAFLGGGKRPWEFLHINNKHEDFAQIGRWMQEGKVRAVVDEVFRGGKEDKGPVKAYGKLRTGRARGKIVVTMVDEWEE